MALREQIQALGSGWADAAGLTNFKDLQGLTCQAFLEGGEAMLRLRYRRLQTSLAVAL